MKQEKNGGGKKKQSKTYISHIHQMNTVKILLYLNRTHPGKKKSFYKKNKKAFRLKTKRKREREMSPLI